MTNPLSSIASQPDAIHLHGSDNIVVAARDLAAGEVVEAGGRRVELLEPVTLGHKVAVQPIGQGEAVLKFGQVIGFARQPIEPGRWAHVHNVGMGDLDHDYAFASDIPPDPQPVPGLTDRTFMGYRRADGRVGTRNYIAVISAVNCSASVSKYVTRRFDAAALKDFPNVDGVIAITHGGGCGIQFASENHQQFNRVLAGFARHANVGAYLLIGLGCEVATMSSLVEEGGLVQVGVAGDRKPPVTLSIQDCGGIAKTVDEGVKLVAQMLPQVNEARREPCPASEILLGLECGGSDGNSGVTANPALGVASDLLVAAGGTAMLAEVPEIYGAEHLLTRRARTREVGQKLIDRIEWWKWYTGIFGAEINNNPTPGNKAGGLTTIYEKSLGAVAKGGTTALNDVLKYAEPVVSKGFVVMDTPGYDPASITGLVAGGANVVCFTTGRGSCYGCKPTPSIKIASNTPMYERMSGDMDINAGVVLQGTPVEEVGRLIFEQVLDVASGRQTKSEAQGVGEEEFVPWSIGPTL